MTAHNDNGAAHKEDALRQTHVSAARTSEARCVCGHADVEHAGRGRGTGSTFCINDDCECEEFTHD